MKKGSEWVYHQEHFLGIPVSIAMPDPHSGNWWVCLDHRHWGPKLQYSQDQGKSWVEVDAPKYPEDAEIEKGVTATLRYIWIIAFGVEPGIVYLGTEPGGLFKSNDSGRSFELVRALWDHPSRPEHWFGGGRNHAGIHSIVIDPADKNHYYIGVSCAGVFETRDNGKSWIVRNKGLRADYLPNPQVEVGHDPHFVLACNSDPRILWQQNHCGIFRSTNGGEYWEDITDEQNRGRYGFALGIDHEDPLKAWVVPATSDSQRIAVDRSLFVMHTRDGGRSWEEQREGLPQQNCFDIVLRHAMDVAGEEIAMGTSGGSLYVSENGGVNWTPLNHHLPRIFSARFT
jgi:photosystem II stability/assembly factor-like uncharacterized protein